MGAPAPACAAAAAADLGQRDGGHDVHGLDDARDPPPQATLRSFFDALGPARSALITHVSADGADWIGDVMTQRCPAAVRCADPFHLIAWATDALDEVRRQVWNKARRAGDTQRAKQLKGARYALW